MRELFTALYEHCAWRIELRAFAVGKTNRRKFVNVTDIDAIEHFYKSFYDYNVYFGVCTRDKSGSGRKENVVEMPALWAEVDFKDTPTTDVKTNLDRFPMRPSASVLSGHGVHFYWILKEPVTTDFDKAEDLLRRICFEMGADSSACEIARVLRVPGSMNVKDKPIPVKLHWLKSFRYILEDFEVLPEFQANPKKKINTNSTNPPHWMIEAFRGVPEHGNGHFKGRDVAATKIVGYFINRLCKKDLLHLLQCWNVRNEPPLKDGDLFRIINSIGRYKEEQNGTPEKIRTGSIKVQFEKC